MAEQIRFQFAVYYLPKPLADPQTELDSLVKDQFPQFQLTDEIDRATKDAVILAHTNNDPASTYAPPDLQSLKYFGRGLSREQAVALQECQVAFVMGFAYSQSQVWEGMRSAVKLTDALARKTGGLIWDEETREVFTPDYWRESRLESWTEAFPDISAHTTIHAYQDKEFTRSITLGMAKFGLPDIVVENFSWSHSRPMGNLINLLAQAFAEGVELPKPGQLELDINSIQNAAVRQSQLDTLMPNATANASLTLTVARHQAGDPENRLIEIGFDGYDGPDLHARQANLLGKLFGWEDAITPVEHDAALEAASMQARTKLPQLRTQFNSGLAPGEFILLKAPFATPDGGQEWMWVEVIEWKGDRIKGLLKNEPFNIPELHAGQLVQVSEAEVFDYIRSRPDGTSEGNETGKLIEKLSKRSRKAAQ